jgi:hypothetical protein
VERVAIIPPIKMFKEKSLRNPIRFLLIKGLRHNL